MTIELGCRISDSVITLKEFFLLTSRLVKIYKSGKLVYAYMPSIDTSEEIETILSKLQEVINVDDKESPERSSGYSYEMFFYDDMILHSYVNDSNEKVEGSDANNLRNITIDAEYNPMTSMVFHYSKCDTIMLKTSDSGSYGFLIPECVRCHSVDFIEVRYLQAWINLLVSNKRTTITPELTIYAI